jgi:hypothetical protein
LKAALLGLAEMRGGLNGVLLTWVQSRRGPALWESGRGLPQSKTLARGQGPTNWRSFWTAAVFCRFGLGSKRSEGEDVNHAFTAHSEKRMAL